MDVRQDLLIPPELLTILLLALIAETLPPSRLTTLLRLIAIVLPLLDTLGAPA